MSLSCVCLHSPFSRKCLHVCVFELIGFRYFLLYFEGPSCRSLFLLTCFCFFLPFSTSIPAFPHLFPKFWGTALPKMASFTLRRTKLEKVFWISARKCPLTSLLLPSHCPGLEIVTAHCVCSPFLERERETGRGSKKYREP